MSDQRLIPIANHEQGDGNDAEDQDNQGLRYPDDPTEGESLWLERDIVCDEDAGDGERVSTDAAGCDEHGDTAKGEERERGAHAEVLGDIHGLEGNVHHAEIHEPYEGAVSPEGPFVGYFLDGEDAVFDADEFFLEGCAIAGFVEDVADHEDAYDTYDEHACKQRHGVEEFVAELGSCTL